MKRKLFLSILIVFFTTSFLSIVGCNNQDNNRKVDYQLQEQCGKSCKEYNKGKEGWYECHYNKKLNKCFYYYNHLSSGSELFDLHEHKCLGRCMDNSCSFYVLNKRGIKQDEWDKLVKPYMEE